MYVEAKCITIIIQCPVYGKWNYYVRFNYTHIKWYTVSEHRLHKLKMYTINRQMTTKNAKQRVRLIHYQTKEIK